MELPDLRVIIVQGLGFLLILAVFKFFLFKPIADILDARRREIEERFTDAEAQRAQAAEMKAEYEQHLARIEEEMRAKITQAVKEGQAMREEILAESRERADVILTKAQEEIAREREIAMAELRNAVAGLAIKAAGRIIEEKLDENKHRELVNKFIDNLDEVHK